MTDWTNMRAYLMSSTANRIVVASPFHDAWDKLAKRLELERSRTKN